MPLFGKKKTETSEVRKDVEETKKVVEQQTPPQKVEHKEEKEPERPAFAPLFVKIDRYRSILNSLGYLKTALVMVKNSFATLNELERARNQTLDVIQKALEKIEKKISSLDIELVRPAGFHEPTEAIEYHDVETIEATIADLKGQIDQLKAELENMT